MPATKARPIIVIKKKGGHGGHHGGAWKVAYADFVTAMMSLFIVLWLMGSSSKVKQAVAGYFNDPKGTAKLLGTTMSGTGVTPTPATQDLQKLKEKLEKEIAAKKDLLKLSKQIEITVTPEGLRIELIEDKNGTFFQSGSARLSDKGQELLALLGTELKTLPNNLLIEGYTDAAKYSNNSDYGNWELSADRANSARRLLQQDGVSEDQVTQIRAYADHMLRVPANPFDASNRRVSILVKNLEGPIPNLKGGEMTGGSSPEPPAPAKPETAEGGKHEPAVAAPPTPVKPSAAKPAAAAAKSSFFGKLKGLLPGKN